MLSFDFRCLKGFLAAILDPRFSDCYEKLRFTEELKLTGAVFNPSLCKVSDGIYFGVARVSISEKNAEGFAPGNSPICKNEKYPSKLFFWNNWNSRESPLNEYSILFVIADGQVSPLKFEHVVSNPVMGCSLPVDDYRIAVIDGRIVLSGSTLDNIYVVSTGENDLLRLEHVTTPHPNGGKNMTLLRFQTLDDPHRTSHAIYIDWFYSEGVKFVLSYSREYYIRQEFGEDFDPIDIPFQEYKLKMKKVEENAKKNPVEIKFLKCTYPIVGSGSWDSQKQQDIEKYGINYGIMPMFSLGTPVIEYKGMYLGCGHTKIHTDEQKYPYIEGSRIQKFRECVHATLEKKHGSKYRRHLGTVPLSTRYFSMRKQGEDPSFLDKTETCAGYIYLFYFYMISKELDMMYISDSYLPVSPADNLEYTFSLFFPMGIILEGSELTVTGGYGDYYPMSLHFDVRDVEKECRHDITNLMMTSYDYHMI